ncbi:MAG: NAD(P)/FAD-dependent oxidoreductase [Pirellula sp.]
MSSRYDLAVVGGGVVGLSIAVACAKRGWSVCLIERSSIGKESSWAGAGILPAGATVRVEDPIEQLRQLSDALHQEWADWLLAYTGIDTEYRRCGGLYVARTAAEKATLLGNCLWWDELGIEYQELDQEALRRMSPWVAPRSTPQTEANYYWVPKDAQLRNPRHVAALRAACEKLGVKILENAEVQGMRVTGSVIEDVSGSIHNEQGREFRVIADRYCLATGAWTALLLKPLGIETGIYPVRGQMQLYRFDRPHFSFVVNEGHRYLVPRLDGRILVGSCEEEVGFQKATTEQMMSQLRSWALSVCPEIIRGDLEFEWSGLRPGSIDSFPYLGTLHPYRNGYIAAGHFRHGLHWSTATAVLMAAHMRGEPTAIDLEPFRLQRGNVA